MLSPGLSVRVSYLAPVTTRQMAIGPAHNYLHSAILRRMADARALSLADMPPASLPYAPRVMRASAFRASAHSKVRLFTALTLRVLGFILLARRVFVAVSTWLLL